MKSVLLLAVFVLCGYFSDAQSNSDCQLPGVEVGGAARRYCPLRCPQCQEAGECHSAPGSLVSAPVTRVQCAPGHRLDDDKNYSLVACDKGNWIGRFPECLDDDRRIPKDEEGK